ncbi:hypothetical protein C8R45DRAFT_1109400 [Mycena sanguinolenta]|nr:hypothetical protein C8R45DRAFT_1109400 [Mycena sanguinolenta]
MPKLRVVVSGALRELSTFIYRNVIPGFKMFYASFSHSRMHQISEIQTWRLATRPSFDPQLALSSELPSPTLSLNHYSLLHVHSFARVHSGIVRLVRALFGVPSTGDLEGGTLVPVAAKIQANKQGKVIKEPIPTFQPDIAGVPALVLTSIAIGAAFAPETPIAVKAAHFPTQRSSQLLSKPVDAGRSPLRSITNAPRVHGKTQRHTRVPDKAKKNMRLHPNVPRLCHPRVESATPSLVATTRQVVTIASPEWERAKASQLKQAKEWSNAVKARRRALPIPPKHALAAPSLRASLPARLSVSERLRRAVAGCLSPPPTPAAVAPLWGHDNVSFVLADDEDQYAVGVNLSDTDTDHQLRSSTSLGSSTLMSSASSGSVSSIIEAYETDFASSAWFGLRQFAWSDGGNRTRSGLGAGTMTRDVGRHPGYEDDERRAGSDSQEADEDDR